jgi:mannose-1-phosphate guanylyltransferase/phosphomannomutase
METNKDRAPYKLAVSVVASGEIEEIAKGYKNVTVVRIPNSHSAMMEATRDKEILFVGDTRGRLIFTEFFFASDAMFAIGKILDMLAATGKSISAVDKEIPTRFQFNRQTPCPWEKKGLIMRRAMEYSEGMKRELIDGVKIIDGDVSVLFLPDKERGIFHATAEAADKTKALEAAEKHIKLVEQWRDAE